MTDKIKKICFITTLIKDKTNESQIDSPGNPEIESNEIYDLFLFTNIENYEHTKWKVIYIDDNYLDEIVKFDKEKDFNKKIHIYKSRYFKFMGWHYIENVMKKKYDTIFYCDAILSPRKNSDWQLISNKIINSENGILQKKHPKRPTAYDECNRAADYKDTKENMQKMIELLEKFNTPKDYIICENTSFGYDPNNQKIKDIFTEFWNTYIDNKVTYRDQPLWAAICSKNNFKPIYSTYLHTSWKKDNRNFYFKQDGTSFHIHRRYY